MKRHPWPFVHPLSTDSGDMWTQKLDRKIHELQWLLFHAGNCTVTVFDVVLLIWWLVVVIGRTLEWWQWKCLSAWKLERCCFPGQDDEWQRFSPVSVDRFHQPVRVYNGLSDVHKILCKTQTPNHNHILLRLSSSRSEQNIGRRVVSIWHGRWQYLSRHSSQRPVCPSLLSVCLAMSSLVFQPSSCHLLASILRPDYLIGPDRAISSSCVMWSRYKMPRMLLRHI